MKKLTLATMAAASILLAGCAGADGRVDWKAYGDYWTDHVFESVADTLQPFPGR